MISVVLLAPINGCHSPTVRHMNYEGLDLDEYDTPSKDPRFKQMDQKEE